ncbi:hypothetical protein ACFVWY_18200 [Streptomyces sp. NPDC058195]|uniref:hypothetical protein n=1 Tax=Streptomyces sp. NPDC058195 TaxID=3346375 RepID=UPI0036E8C099
MSAAETACRLSRGAPERLAGAMAAPADGPAPAFAVFSLLATAGARAGAAGPALARLAEGAARSEGAGEGEDAGEGCAGGTGGAADSDGADLALATLVVVAPGRAAPLLARHLSRRPRARAAACGFLNGPVIPFDPALLDAVRARLATDGLEADEVLQLVLLLGAWGSRAAAALPELRGALPVAPRAAPEALVALCPPEHRAATAEVLTVAARTGPQEGRLAAARAVRELTGESAPLLAAVAAGLVPGGGGRGVARRGAGPGRGRTAARPAVRAQRHGGRAHQPGAGRRCGDRRRPVADHR